MTEPQAKKPTPLRYGDAFTWECLPVSSTHGVHHVDIHPDIDRHAVVVRTRHEDVASKVLAAEPVATTFSRDGKMYCAFGAPYRSGEHEGYAISVAVGRKIVHGLRYTVPVIVFDPTTNKWFGGTRHDCHGARPWRVYNAVLKFHPPPRYALENLFLRGVPISPVHMRALPDSEYGQAIHVLLTGGYAGYVAARLGGRI